MRLLTLTILIFLQLNSRILNAQTSLFYPITTAVPNTNDIFSIMPADIDNDGDTDIVYASNYDDTVGWYPNDGTGTFGEAFVISNVAIGAIDVYVTDIDLDGDEDVLYASYDADHIAWYENNGHGNFSASITITQEANSASTIYAADLNQDGFIDVAYGSMLDDKIAWFQNDGIGNFTIGTTITELTNGVTDIIIADLDGDDDGDVISASQYDNKIAWYRNDGNGNFGNQILITNEVVFPKSLFSIDIDLDGDSDLISASKNDNKIAWYENDGMGNFGLQNIIDNQVYGASSVYACDLDGDGDNDVIAASNTNDQIKWYENFENGIFFVPRLITQDAEGVTIITAAHINEDNYLDIISNNYDENKISWNKNKAIAESEFIHNSCHFSEGNDSILNISNFNAMDNTTYQWYVDGIPVSIEKNLATELLDVGINSISLVSCTSTTCDSINHEITFIKFILDPVTTIQTNTPYTFENESNGITYWVWEFGDGTMSEEETPIHTYTEPGIYELEVNIYNTNISEDCFTQIEYWITVVDSISAYNNPYNIHYTISPNPAYDKLTIHNGDLLMGAELTISDLQGRILATEILNGQSSLTIDLRTYKSGFYLLKIGNTKPIKLALIK